VAGSLRPHHAAVGVHDELTERLRASCEDRTFVRLVLSSPADASQPVQRVAVRLVEQRGALVLSCTRSESRRDTVANLPLAEGMVQLAAELRGFRSALLATTAADWQLQHDRDGVARLVRHKPSQPVAPARTHDVARPTLLGPAAQPWLHGLGLVDAEGRTRPRLADKRTQLDRYVEILAHLARDCGWEGTREAPPLRFVDVGCGKGHLTFAAWHLVHHVLGRRAQGLGVETRADLVSAAEALARQVTGDELHFVQGDIGSVALPELDLLVALHACNTATDHAIHRGIAAQARLIVVAPCCHQEVRPQLASPEPLAPVLAHGLMAERMAEWVTEGLRTLVLEWAGYRTKVVEFVDLEHSGKNLMLAAVRRERVPGAAEQAAARARIEAFSAYFGVRSHALDPVWGRSD
jgi:SAM-dependent methyltransferase